MYDAALLVGLAKKLASNQGACPQAAQGRKHHSKPNAMRLLLILCSFWHSRAFTRLHSSCAPMTTGVTHAHLLIILLLVLIVLWKLLAVIALIIIVLIISLFFLPSSRTALLILLYQPGARFLF